MRVLEVVHGFPPSAQGGSEIYAETHARALVRSGDAVLVLTRDQDREAPEYHVRAEDRDGFRVVWVNNTFRATRTFAETYANPAVDAVAERVIDEFHPDVAHVHHLTCLSTGLVERLAQRAIPCIVTLHDYWLLCHRGQLLDRHLRVCPGPEPDGCDWCLDETAGVGQLGHAAAGPLRTAERWLPSGARRAVRAMAVRLAARTTSRDARRHEATRRLRHMRRVTDAVTHFLAPSNHFRQRFIAFGVSPDRITHAPYGFDHRPFRGLQQAAATDRLRVGFLGSLMVSKAPHLLLEAYRGLPPGVATVDLFGAHVDYHGDRFYRDQLAPLLALDGVHLHGPVAHEQIPGVLASLDLLVVPSVWPENSPLVIHEAFLAGVPVVASRAGGIPELVRDGENGLLVPPGHVGALRSALLRLVTEPALLETLRRGLPPIRTIEDDVAAARQLYQRLVERRARPAPQRIAAVILSYGTPDDTLLTARSLLASRRPIDDLIVVDNEPSDRCQRVLAPLEDRVTLIRNTRNLGFSGGMNVGIRDALERGATRVLLVNSDVFVPPDCVNALDRALDRTPGAGIAGPVERARATPDRIVSLGISYRPSTGRMRHLGFGATADGPAPTGPVAAVSGCLMLVRREVLESIGWLDEDYFFSFEDLDFCLRARRAGFSTIVVGSAAVYHEGARSIGTTSPDRLYYATRNHLLVARRSAASAGRFQSFCRGLSIVGLNLAHAVRFKGASLPTRVAAVLKGTRDYVRGRLGPLVA